VAGIILAIVKSTLFVAGFVAALVTGCKTQGPSAPSAPSRLIVIRATDGSAQITIDTSKAPDLNDWAAHKLAPVLAQWYPKICAMLPTPGFTPPTNWSVVIAPGNGVAATSGRRITANATWIREQLGKQAIGALVHEEGHVVQQYGAARRNMPPGNFANGDITNLVSLANKITTQADPVSAFLNHQLTASELHAIATYHGPGPTAYRLRVNLVAVLNRVVQGSNIYDATLFRNVTLRDSTASLRDDKPDGTDLARLNRALLEDAFPGELARRGSGRNRGNTGWLTEGIPDYIRWFLYEPRSHAAEKGRVYEPKYNDSYRVSANFLNFVTGNYDRHIVTKLNNALRQGQYYDDMWADITGKSVQQLNEEWLVNVHKELKKLKTEDATPAPGKA